MKRKLTIVGVAALVATASIAVVAVQASSTSSKHRTVAASTTVQRDVLSLSAAQQLATAAQADCAKRGFAVTVAVVDPDGLDILVQRADGATGADRRRRARQGACRSRLPECHGGSPGAGQVQPRVHRAARFRDSPGGQPIFVGKSLVGGVGVSGAPSGAIDDLCAETGLKTIA